MNQQSVKTPVCASSTPTYPTPSSPPSWPSGAPSSSWLLSTTGSSGYILADAVTLQIWPWYSCCKCSILLCRCKSRCCKCTNIFDAFPDAGVRWSRKRRWRWPQSICPPSTDMLGGPSPPIFPTLKSSDPKSLSLDQFSQRWNPVIRNHFRLKSWSDPKSFSVRCTEGGQVKDKQLEGEKFKLRPSVVVGTSWGEKSRMIF